MDEGFHFIGCSLGIIRMATEFEVMFHSWCFVPWMNDLISDCDGVFKSCVNMDYFSLINFFHVSWFMDFVNPMSDVDERIEWEGVQNNLHCPIHHLLPIFPQWTHQKRQVNFWRLKQTRSKMNLRIFLTLTATNQMPPLQRAANRIWVCREKKESIWLWSAGWSPSREWFVGKTRRWKTLSDWSTIRFHKQ